MQRIFLLFLIFFITSCASGSFYSYSNSLKQDVANSNQSSKNSNVKTIEIAKIQKDTLNGLLYSQESGLYSFLKQDYSQAIKYFEQAEDKYNYFDRQSELELKKLTKNTLTYTILDDNAIPYQGSDYERALVNYYKALSYLAQGDLQSSLIEFRASSQVQKLASHVRRQKINKAEREVQKYNIKNKLKNNSLDDELKIANLKSKFLNANSYYISGHIREIQGDANGALVDYKKALEIEPNNSYYITDVYRLALIFDRDYARSIEKKYTIKDLQQKVQDYENSNTVLIIQDQGFIPTKRQSNITLLINSHYINIPLPYYKNNFYPYNTRLGVIKQGENSQNTNNNFETASNIFRLEYNNLSEQYPLILTRAITRQATSIATTEAIKNKRNSDGSIDAVALFTSVAMDAFKTADLRSWRNLPAQTLVAKASIKENENIYIKTSNNDGVLIKGSDIISNNKPSLAIIYVYSVYGEQNNKEHKNDIYSIIYKGKKF